MCRACDEDPRDALHNGLRALEGLRDLLLEATGHDKRQYEVVGPDGLAELVGMVHERLARAGDGMEFYMPRP